MHLDEDSYNFTASQEIQGQRIDVFAAQQLEVISRSYIQKLIAAEYVKVNGKVVKANYKLQCGDAIEIILPELEPIEVAAENIPLDVLYEDEDVIVINKPRGMVVHPAPGNYSGTLVNALLNHCENLSGINGKIRPGIVHRLDKDTSGVMVAAKSDRAHASLAGQIKDRTASRKYLAIVHGNLEQDHGVINAPIGRHPTDRKKMAVVFTNSKEAVTRFTVISRFGAYTLVECKLLTGRTHQIRVHMAYIGHPVAGDPVYGPLKPQFAIAGQALHARELTFQHPVTNETLAFAAPLPEDMRRILDKLEGERR